MREAPRSSRGKTLFLLSRASYVTTGWVGIEAQVEEGGIRGFVWRVAVDYFGMRVVDACRGLSEGVTEVGS